MPAAPRPPFRSFPVVEAPSVRLRPLSAADVPALLPISFFDGRLARNHADAHRMQGLIAAEYRAGRSIHWGIEDAATGRLVGTCGYYRGFTDEAGEIGYVLLPECRGRGYATAAVRAAVAFGFTALGLRRVLAFTDPDNHPSVAVLRRAGFVEGEPTATSRTFYRLPDAP